MYIVMYHKYFHPGSQIWFQVHAQRAKKVVSESLWLLDYAIGQVNFVHTAVTCLMGN